tara:strand:- start:960 stop:2408 length:1449 start_codon:yes stop_codon:yes gene_type:complete
MNNLKNAPKVIPVILSGGSGTRLWPLSRSNFPKQFLNLSSNDNKSLFQLTQERLKGFSFIDNPIIVCNEEHRFLAAEQLREINIKPKSILLEPFSRNTAPAVTIAAIKALEEDIDSTILVLPADHKINNSDVFAKVIKLGSKIASNERLVAFGIVPTYPETGYGYIESTSSFRQKNIEAHKISKFIEKPDLKTAEFLVNSKRFTWNSGMYIFKSKVFLNEIKKFEPELFENCKKSISKKYFDLDFQRLSSSSFEKCLNISLDVAVMEKTALGMVIPLNAGWSDIGSWKSLWESEEKDDLDNVKYGRVFTSKVKNSYLRSEHRLIVALGIKNLIIIETGDVVLIANKESSQDIKFLVSQLNEKGLLNDNLNNKIYRPWGNYTSIAEGEEWKVKRIEVKPGESLSLQLHNHRAEHWVIVHGLAEVEIEEKKFKLKKNQSVFVPKGSKHRLSNRSNSPLIIVEVQSGDYLGEDDIKRFQDNYGRI